ncbi:MAG: DUF899 family protein [Phycisphaeraceae bacterium]|nr:DUF899 family protein [Phycisphaerales bacterium]MCB9861148.1 DUF899 family protein [Phycisphaeraceae bacterium]
MTTTSNAFDTAREVHEALMGYRKEFNEKLAAVPEEPVNDYTFMQSDGTEISLADMFGDKAELLVIHNMGIGCNYCALWADAFIGLSRHIEQRCGFYLSSPDTPEILTKRIADRGWPFKCVSVKENTFARDMGFQGATGYYPGISAFHKKPDGSIVRTGARQFCPGDDFCGIWSAFDIIKSGANGWEPK